MHLNLKGTNINWYGNYDNYAVFSPQEQVITLDGDEKASTNIVEKKEVQVTEK